MDMIEKVARAIAASEGDDYLEHQAEFDRYARAAIEAMREPTHPMVLEASKHSIVPDLIWGTMINVALAPALSTPHRVNG